MTQSIKVLREQQATHGTYRARVPGTQSMAELAWSASGQDRIATSTFVPPAARGKGIAGALVAALIADARTMGFKIVPQCSYVVTAFQRHPEWADVLARPPG